MEHIIKQIKKTEDAATINFHPSNLQRVRETILSYANLTNFKFDPYNQNSYAKININNIRYSASFAKSPKRYGAVVDQLNITKED